MQQHTTNRRSRKRIAGLAALLFVGGGGAAYAYWTTTGSGTGTATTGTDTPIFVIQTSVVEGMGPGVAPQTLSGNFNNPNPGPVYVGTVTAAIDTVTKAAGAPAGDCDATDYTLDDEVVTINAEIPRGNGVGSWTGPQISFNNKADDNQDACKGATVTFRYTVA